jgi:hypothetical protein
MLGRAGVSHWLVLLAALTVLLLPSVEGRLDDGKRKDNKKFLHLDIDISALSDADHHIEKKFHDDVYIKFLDSRDRVLCNAKLATVVDDTIPCDIPRRLLKRGRNLVHAVVYLEHDPSEEVEHFDLSFNIGHNVKGVQDLRPWYLLTVAAILGAAGLYGGNNYYTYGTVVVPLLIDRNENATRIANTLSLSDSSDKKPKPQGSPFGLLRNRLTVLNTPKTKKVIKGLGIGAGAGLLGGMLIGLLIRGPKDKASVPPIIVKAETIEDEEPEKEGGLGAYMSKLVGVLLAPLVYAIFRKKPPTGFNQHWGGY